MVKAASFWRNYGYVAVIVNVDLRGAKSGNWLSFQPFAGIEIGPAFSHRLSQVLLAFWHASQMLWSQRVTSLLPRTVTIPKLIANLAPRFRRQWWTHLVQLRWYDNSFQRLLFTHVRVVAYILRLFVLFKVTVIESLVWFHHYAEVYFCPFLENSF